MKKNEISLDVIQATKRLGFNRADSIYNKIKKGVFPNAYKEGGSWHIPLKDVISYEMYLNRTRDMLDVKQVAKRLGCSSSTIINTLIVLNKKFPNAFKQGGKWYIPEKDVIAYENKTKNMLNTRQAAKRLGYEHVASIATLIYENKKFPNAFKQDGRWYIPEKDISAFEDERAEVNKKIIISPKVASKEFLTYVNKIKINKKVFETRKIYIKYVLYQINNMNGSNGYKKSRVSTYKNLYNKMINTLSDEIFLISMKEVEKILSKESSFAKIDKRIFIPFLKFAYSEKGMDLAIDFGLLSPNKRKKSKDVYSPELFYEIYQHVKMIETHKNHAIKSRHYSNMWVYTILLLTDFIRGQDLIMNTPSIDLSGIEIRSFTELHEKNLSDYTSQLIINQLQLHFRNKRTSKTDELLTFIVAPDLVQPLAYALVISELHRDHETNELMLNTFLIGKYNRIKTQGKAKHLRFFDKINTVSNFRFSSLKMNRTVATYLFYSIAENDGSDSDLALYLSKVSRSHKTDDSTSRYIQSTNKDGSINRVSYNLFKRGHFGWLFDSLLSYISQFDNIKDSLEDRSKLIEEIQKKNSPSYIEDIGKYVHSSLTPIDIKKESNNMSMEMIIENIYNKKQSIISMLRNYSKEEIIEVIINLSQGNFPSKNEYAQCLIYPDCKYPNRSNCFSCEYLIPGNLMLIQLNEELKRVINNIKSSTNEILIRRDSMFLMHALLIWKEARKAFGDEKTSAFIPIENTWHKIEAIAHKILIN